MLKWFKRLLFPLSDLESLKLVRAELRMKKLESEANVLFYSKALAEVSTLIELHEEAA